MRAGGIRVGEHAGESCAGSIGGSGSLSMPENWPAVLFLWEKPQPPTDREYTDPVFRLHPIAVNENENASRKTPNGTIFGRTSPIK